MKKTADEENNGNLQKETPNMQIKKELKSHQWEVNLPTSVILNKPKFQIDNDSGNSK